MKTATLLKTQTSEADAEQRVYRLDPPHVEDGEIHDIVVVSAVYALFSGPETYIFPGTADGEITDFVEMAGSYRGGLDHEEALRGMGYEVFNGDTVVGEVVTGELES